MLVASVMVAALVNGSDNREGDRHRPTIRGSMSFVRMATTRSSKCSMPAISAVVARSFRAVDHVHGVVPVHERGHHHWGGHAQGDGNERGLRS
jgi:hypothetical protein